VKDSLSARMAQWLPIGTRGRLCNSFTTGGSTHQRGLVPATRTGIRGAAMREGAGYGFQHPAYLPVDFAGSTIARTQTQAPRGYSIPSTHSAQSLSAFAAPRLTVAHNRSHAVSGFTAFSSAHPAVESAKPAEPDPDCGCAKGRLRCCRSGFAGS
jgi:hypothetical protein